MSSEHREGILFNDVRPPHAFPTPYSDKFGTDSFVSINFGIASRYWMRSPATHTPHHSSLSVDGLADLSAQMNIRASTRPSRCSKSSANQCRWASPLAVAPSTTPHPAIVSPRYVSLRPTIQTTEHCTWQKASIRTRKRTTCHSQSSYPLWDVPNTSQRHRSPWIPRHAPQSLPHMNTFGTSPRSPSSSRSLTSSGNRSTSMCSTSSTTSQTTVELLDASQETMMSSFLNLVDLAPQWKSGAACDSQLLATLPRGEVSDLSTSLTLSDFVATNLPSFPFFE